MLAELDISGKKYYLLCEANETSMYCSLYDEKESLYESAEFDLIFDRAKSCNKRIHYDETTVKTTLQKERPIGATLLLNDKNAEEYILTLKYKVQLYPFTFLWYLKKQTKNKFHVQLMDPIFKLLDGLKAQNTELCSALRKRDNEVFRCQLYSGETVLTPRFDLKQFEKKYANTEMLFNIFKQLEPHLKEKTEIALIENTAEQKSAENNLQLESQRQSASISPASNIFCMGLKRKFEYLSSDSSDD